MKRWLLVIMVVVGLYLVLACSGTTFGPPLPVDNNYSPKQEGTSKFAWHDNGINAVYFPWDGERFTEALGDWQRQYPGKEIIIPPGSVLNTGGVANGYIVFYRSKLIF